MENPYSELKTRKNKVGWKIPKQCWIVGPTGLRKSIGNTSDRYLWSTQCVLLRFFVNKGNLWSIQLIPHENKKEKSWMKNSKTLLDSGTHWTQKLYWQHFRQISVVYTVCFVTIFSVNKGFYGAYSLFHMKTRKNKVGWKIPKHCWIVGPTGLRKSIGNTSDRYLWSTQCVLLRFYR